MIVVINADQMPDAKIVAFACETSAIDWNTATIPQTGETAGYFWETVTLPGGTTYLHPDQLTVLDQAGHPLCTYDLTNHWGYASYPFSETR